MNALKYSGSLTTEVVKAAPLMNILIQLTNNALHVMTTNIPMKNTVIVSHVLIISPGLPGDAYNVRAATSLMMVKPNALIVLLGRLVFLGVVFNVLMGNNKARIELSAYPARLDTPAKAGVALNAAPEKNQTAGNLNVWTVHQEPPAVMEHAPNALTESNRMATTPHVFVRTDNNRTETHARHAPTMKSAWAETHARHVPET